MLFLEERIANVEDLLRRLIEAVDKLSGGPIVVAEPVAPPTPPAPVVAAAPAAAPAKTPSVSHEIERIKAALMAVKRAGGSPAEILAKAGFAKLSDVQTPSDVAAVDALLEAA